MATPRQRRPTDRLTGLVRVLQLIELLKRHPCDVPALAEELQVSRRTVLRYLSVIERAGAFELKATRRDGEPQQFRIQVEARP